MASATRVDSLVMRGQASARIHINGRKLINFAGCSYLALGNLPEIRNAAVHAIEGGAAFALQIPAAYGLVDPDIRDVERAAADYCGTQEAVYLPSGYLIGAAALVTLDTSRSHLFIDEQAHFSLFDAARLTGRPVVPFRHCDSESLANAIRTSLAPQMRPVVLSDGVFGTTGRVAPLDDYASVLAPYDARLVVDEAHSFGVLGRTGRGAAEHHAVDAVTVTAATLSKAFCAQGAIIPCSDEAAARVRSLPPLRGANAGSPISAAVAAAAIRHAQAHPERRRRLIELAVYLRARLRTIGIEVRDTPAPIVAFQLGDRAAMAALQGQLFQHGIHVMVSSYIGSGAEGMVRCAVFADHSEADLDALVDCLGRHEWTC